MVERDLQLLYQHHFGPLSTVLWITAWSTEIHNYQRHFGPLSTGLTNYCMVKRDLKLLYQRHFGPLSTVLWTTGWSRAPVPQGLDAQWEAHLDEELLSHQNLGLGGFGVRRHELSYHQKNTVKLKWVQHEISGFFSFNSSVSPMLLYTLLEAFQIFMNICKNIQK